MTLLEHLLAATLHLRRAGVSPRAIAEARKVVQRDLSPPDATTVDVECVYCKRHTAARFDALPKSCRHCGRNPFGGTRV